MAKMQENIALTLAQSIKEEFSKMAERLSQIPDQKTKFKKDKICPIKGCRKRYSSRIALKAHVKRKHPKKPLNEVSD